MNNTVALQNTILKQSVTTPRQSTWLIALDNKFQKNFCICDEYGINLFVCIYEVRKGT